MFTSLRFPALFAALFILVSNNVAAINFCLPQDAPKRFVGDVATDGLCTDNDIQSAINNVAGVCPTTIYITREHLYTAQHLTISNQSVGVTLVGMGDGVHCGSTAPQICDPTLGCPPPPTAPLVTIDGTGQSGQSVITIGSTSNVALRYLRITGGNLSSAQTGGGIYFGGAGSLTLDTDTINFNAAGYGGGIDMNGSGGNATLTLLSNTLILSNTAQISGGGLRMEGSSRLFALQDATLIAFNHALGGNGGGMEVLGPARADIASPGYNGGAVIQFNDAQYGGGIAATAAESNGANAMVRLFTIDPQRPVQIASNTAARTGGGIYLKPWSGSFPSTDLSEANLCAFDFRIDDNIAQEGTAIYADTAGDTSYSSLGNVYMNTDPFGLCSQPEAPPSLGAVACATGVPCNTVSGNIAEDGNNTPTPGAAILVQDGGSFTVDRLLMRGNQGAHAIRTFGPDPYTGFAYVHNCLIADNQVTGELVRIDNDVVERSTSFVNCTFANNTIGGSTVIYSGHDLDLADIIFDQPGVPTLAYAGNPANLAVSYVLTNSNGTLPAQPDVVVGRPTYVNSAGGDYHLTPASLGIDFAPAAGGTDLDRLPRDVDLPAVPNSYGPRDLGAYEHPFTCAGADTIFCDGFGP